VTALQAAWAAIRETAAATGEDHVRFALETAVHIGHDTDTVAAIAGALVGARWGASCVPSEWRRAVRGWPGLEADGLMRLGREIAQAGTGVEGMREVTG
jgi:ADP-ribosylglycohydrolase